MSLGVCDFGRSDDGYRSAHSIGLLLTRQLLFLGVSVAMFGFLLHRVIDKRASETPAPAPAHRHRGTRRAVPIATDTAMDAEIDWQLTNRELQIIDDLLHGWPNKQIAEHLGVSDQTVKNQLSALYRKVGVSGRVELVVTAVKGGVTRFKY